MTALEHTPHSNLHLESQPVPSIDGTSASTPLSSAYFYVFDHDTRLHHQHPPLRSALEVVDCVNEPLVQLEAELWALRAPATAPGPFRKWKHVLDVRKPSRPRPGPTENFALISFSVIASFSHRRTRDFNRIISYSLLLLTIALSTAIRI